jgi:hypothetical protein
MGIAKGKLFISGEQLAKMLQLPDGVEVLAVKPREAKDGFEFLLASIDETVLTKHVALSQVKTIDLEIVEQQIPVPSFITGGLADSSAIVPLHKGEVILTRGQAQLIFDAVNNNIQVKDLSGVATSNAVEINIEEPKKEKTPQDVFEDIVKGVRRKGSW